MKLATLEIPLKTESVTNLREHWAQKADRAATQRNAAIYRMAKVKHEVKPLLRVTLTRRSPRALDDDNLRPALKAIRDGIASSLRVDDRTPLVAWEYRQERGEPAVLVDIEEIE